MSSETAIAVQNISKEYKLGLTGRTRSLGTIAADRMRKPFRRGTTARERIRALDDVTFDVAAGEAVGVIGRNGAGKSTLLKIISRITPPTAGHIDIVGRVGALLEVGTGFHQELTGLENVYLNGTVLGMSKREIDSRLEEIIDFADVHKFLETPVKRYSSGMRVRLAFAVAAHLEPEVLIIDEVLSVGDAAFQIKCLDKMRSIAEDDGRTVLYVSHNLVTIENLCKRALLLVDGRLVFDGETPETLARYLRTLPSSKGDGAAGVFDLKAADRSGSRLERVFKRLELRPGRGEPARAVRMGDPLRIDVEVEGLDAMPEAVLAVTFGSAANQTLFRLSSRMVPLASADSRKPSETVVIDIPSLPLVPGQYHVNLMLGTDPRIGGGPIDQVHRAAEFTVVPADIFGNGHRLGAYDGLFTLPWEWEIRPTVGAREPCR